MTLIDKYNQIYKVIKKKGQYYLIHEHFDKYKENKIAHIIVKGVNNINIYCKNNGLKKLDNIYEKKGVELNGVS